MSIFRLPFGTHIRADSGPRLPQAHHAARDSPHGHQVNTEDPRIGHQISGASAVQELGNPQQPAPRYHRQLDPDPSQNVQHGRPAVEGPAVQKMETTDSLGARKLSDGIATQVSSQPHIASPIGPSEMDSTSPGPPSGPANPPPRPVLKMKRTGGPPGGPVKLRTAVVRTSDDYFDAASSPVTSTIPSSEQINAQLHSISLERTPTKQDPESVGAEGDRVRASTSSSASTIRETPLSSAHNPNSGLNGRLPSAKSPTSPDVVSNGKRPCLPSRV